MEPYSFPLASLADNETGLLGIGANWHPDTLIDAYSKGIFPWPHPGLNEIPWFSPPKRAVLCLEEYRPNKRLIRELKNLGFSYTANSNFKGVIEACRTLKRKKYKGNPNSSWITEDMESAYIELNKRGVAHSIEANLDNTLVGGIYGVFVNNIFSAESMFRLVDNASKASFYMLAETLKELGLKYLDCQIISPHLSSWGVKEIDRTVFLSLLETDYLLKKDFPMGELNVQLGDIV